MEEIGFMRQRTKIQHGQNKEQLMAASAEFYKFVLQNFEVTGLIQIELCPSDDEVAKNPSIKRFKSRSGLKHEFAFALRNHSDFSGSIGRTRGKKVINNPFADVFSENPSSKRFKSDDVKEEPENGLIDNETVQIDLLESSSAGDEAKSTCMEKSKLDLVKSLVLDEPNRELGESVIAESNLTNGAKCPRQEECKVEIPIVIDNNVEGQNALLEKPSRGFTRSSLKPKVEPMEISAVAASSGSTVLSEDACSNGKMSDAIRSLKRSRLEIKMSKQIVLNKVPISPRHWFARGVACQVPFPRIRRLAGLEE